MRPSFPQSQIMDPYRFRSMISTLILFPMDSLLEARDFKLTFFATWVGKGEAGGRVKVPYNAQDTPQYF
jgi:hypothetical protein